MKILIVCTIVLTVFSFSAKAITQQYSIIDLGEGRIPISINDSGQMTGGRYYWSNGELTTICEDAYSKYINSSGLAVGFSTENAFKYQNGTIKLLTTPADCQRSEASGVNSSGDIVGIVYNSSYGDCWALWKNGEYINLGVRGGAVCINDLGQIAGYKGNYAFIYENGVLTNLGTLGGERETYPYAINNKGQVVGYSYSSDYAFHAFLWQNGTLTDLGLGIISGKKYYSAAYGINDLGQVVGSLSNGVAAFIWENGTMYNLNDLIPETSGWQLGDAWSINNKGQIVGSGWYNGASHGFLLTPVPEPVTIILLGFGTIWLGRKREGNNFRAGTDQGTGAGLRGAKDGENLPI